MGRPRRIQRKRTKGWRMPEGAVYVGRPTRWGNRYRVGDCGYCLYEANHEGAHIPMDAAAVVHEYRVSLEVELRYAPEVTEDPRTTLRGRDLVCWCPLDQPCHADVLLELANR